MALTVQEKMELDNSISELISNLVKESIAFNYIDINEMLNKSYAPASIYSSIERVIKKESTIVIDSKYDYVEQKNKYVLKYGLKNLTTFKKVKNLLYFDCCDGLIYDFINKKFNIKIDDFCNYQRIFTKQFLEGLNYEWLFNYTNDVNVIDSIIRNLPHDFYKTMPNGFIKAINNNSTNETLDSLLLNYVLINKYGKYAKFVKSLNGQFSFSILDSFFDNICLPHKFIKMINNDIINGEYGSLYKRIFDFIKDAFSIFNDYKISLIIDDNRGLTQNYKNLKNLIESNRNSVLAKKLQKLNFINGLQIEDYTIVVPQSQEDKQEEGKMQNNCVGYYYDNSIIEGKNLIYFIRKSKNVKKSYITCRYEINKYNTVEARKKNNTNINNPHETEIIAQISKIIHEHLAKAD